MKLTGIINNSIRYNFNKSILKNIAFTSNADNKDTFESSDKKEKPSFLKRILRVVFFAPKTSNKTNISEGPNNSYPANTLSQPVFENETYCELSPIENESDKTKLIEEDSEMARFLRSADYELKIQNASRGKYGDLFAKMLFQENLSDETKRELIKSGLSEEEFLSAVQKLSKSTLKAALNNPTRYINYTQDASYQRFVCEASLKGKHYTDKSKEAEDYMLNFFGRNIAKLAKALRYVDADALNQMMDKRTTGFLVQLNSLNKINEENGKFLKDIIRRTENGNARQKIKLCQLVEIFQTNKFDMNILKDSYTGNIDTNALKEMFKRAILKKTGVDESRGNIKTDFNEEYFHLLFSEYPCLNCSNVESTNDFEILLKEAVSGNFEKYILDETNKFGRANKNTENAFIEYGLDYNEWLHPEIESRDFEYKNGKMSLKMWERNPFEDIFLGNKTRCCSAITTGSNGAAMPIFLLNTAFNVIEMQDERKDTKGMARIYMSEINDKPAMIIDSIELTDIKQMSDEDKIYITENICRYAKDFAQKIAGKKIDVYYIEQDSKIPLNGIKEMEFLQNKFIGDISRDKIYSNRNSGLKWNDIRERARTLLYKV